ncbi:MAG: VacJ family lipoprotein [Psychrilyobacter sp.]|nr:VacJ family lipoprotein [Psychrilyobacter sp.]
MKKIIIVFIIFTFIGCSNSQISDEKLHDSYDYSLTTGTSNIMKAYDPFESMNRRVYYFNYEFDKWVGLPVSDSYKFFFPGVARTGVKNFFSNLYEPFSALNGVLILDYDVFFTSVGRFLINTTVGVLGLFDVATKVQIVEKKRTLNETLAIYGVGRGAYLVLPFLGPSDMRRAGSAVGTFVIRMPLDPISVFTGELWQDIAILGVETIDQRSRVPFRYYGTGTPFEYEYVRLLYFRTSELKIEDVDRKRPL